MGAPITFRPARPEDGPQLLSVHRRAILSEAATAYPLEAVLSWAHGMAARVYAGCMAQGEHFEVAVIDGRLAGFSSTFGDEIKGLFVDPDLTRRGLGGRLLQRALRRLAGDGHGAARVVSALNAEAFYAAMGFVRTGERLEATRGGLAIPVVEMQRPLTTAQSASLWSLRWSQSRSAGPGSIASAAW